MKNTATKFKNLKAVKEIQKIIAQVKVAQVQMQKLVKDKETIAELHRKTNAFRKDVKKYLSDDIERVRAFLDLARDELESVRKQYLNPKTALQGTAQKLRKLALKSTRSKKKVRAKRGQVVAAEGPTRPQGGA